MLDTLQMFGRYAGGLRGFLHKQLTAEECRQMVRRQLATREATFLNLLKRGVYDNPRSPYRLLLENSGTSYDNITEMMSDLGIESTLEELERRGVFVTLDELKARKPIRRPGLEFSPKARDFDNPLLAIHYEAMTGGSRGPRTRLAIDLDLLRYEAAQVSLFVAEFGLAGGRTALWRELPPGLVGIKTCLRHLKLGRSVDEWFTTRESIRSFEDVKFRMFTWLTGMLSPGMPSPTSIPLDSAHRVAQWLAEFKSADAPTLLDTNPSLGVRVCLAAKESHLDISGTCFRFSGEPYTEAKAQIVKEARCRAASQYSVSEVGHIGLACGNPAAPDEVHLMSEKVAMIQRQIVLPRSDVKVGSLLLTTLMHNSPKLLLNAEFGDYGVVEKRSCDCLLDRMGFDVHIREIRSFEKLTSAGVTFLGDDLVALVEDVLPRSFGGTPIDYQFVEEERFDGSSKVTLLVNPILASINEDEVLERVFDHLRTVPGGSQMANVWSQGRHLEISRRRPYTTAALKLLPLHVMPADSRKRSSTV